MLPSILRWDGKPAAVRMTERAGLRRWKPMLWRGGNRLAWVRDRAAADRLMLALEAACAPAPEQRRADDGADRIGDQVVRGVDRAGVASGIEQDVPVVLVELPGGAQSDGDADRPRQHPHRVNLDVPASLHREDDVRR